MDDKSSGDIMFGLIAAGIAGASGVFGHIRSRHFVGQKLRYTSVVEKPLLGVWAGVGATVAQRNRGFRQYGLGD